MLYSIAIWVSVGVVVDSARTPRTVNREFRMVGDRHPPYCTTPL